LPLSLDLPWPFHPHRGLEVSESVWIFAVG
jgi:hypothetical protein